MSPDSGDAAVQSLPPMAGRLGRPKLLALGVIVLALVAGAVVWAINAAVFDCEGRARENSALLQTAVVEPLPEEWIRSVVSGEQCASGEPGGIRVTFKVPTEEAVPLLVAAGWTRSANYADIDVLRRDLDGRHFEAWVSPESVGASARESSFTNFFRMILG